MTQIDLEIKDFTRDRRRIPFRIDDDVFECIPDLPVMVLLDFSGVAEEIGEDVSGAQAGKLFQRMFEMVLTEESYERFMQRMSSKTEPITIGQVQDIMPWIMEVYGMRPTEPSGSSSDGSATPESGLNSTANTPGEALTSDDFRSLSS